MHIIKAKDTDTWQKNKKKHQGHQRPSVSLAEHKQEFLIMKHESKTIFQNGVTGSIRP
jgi:hypothetical protein